MNESINTDLWKHLYLGLFLFSCCYSLFGSLLRLLTTWKSGRPWQQVLGSLVTGLFVAMQVYFITIEKLKDRPPWLFALCGAAGWLGTDIVDLLTTRIIRRYLGLPNGEGKEKQK